jgi:palmitoyl-protein thioesterase
MAMVLVLAPAVATASDNKVCHTDELHEQHPILCHMLDRLAHPRDGEALAEEITAWADERGLLVGSHSEFPAVDGPAQAQARSTFTSSAFASQRPVVFAHGMGDSCFNQGMQDIVNYTSGLLGGVYVTCIPTGKNQHEDTTNGYFLNMDASVDIFADTIGTDPQLAGGFHAIGFSQGNNIIRGYIARYNDPPVDTFLSVNGVNGGVGAVPHCRPKDESSGVQEQAQVAGICELLMEQASNRAYTEWTQEHSFQANYWRDPRPVEKGAYEQYSQLARWNNEGDPINQTLKDNYAKTNNFVWVMATEDTMVWPKEGEHWGAPDPKDPFDHILPMNETEWYIQDLFGLKTAQEAGKNNFESFDGDHLQFKMEDFDRWVQIYLATTEEAQTETAMA